ncbi:MAG: alkaline phosphatase [Bacteroidales bacterium]|nr:alkaline phosphatase [Bacteroidales bacterium]
MKHISTIRLSLAALGTAVALSASALPPKYIFLYIGDGMGMGPSMAAEMYNRQVLKNDTPITMMQFPVAGFCMTYSASSPVTDSAAAGTALATGTKTKNEMLGMNPDSIAVYSIASTLKAKGYGIGDITTVAPDDATPGAFYAHVPNRNMTYEIGVQAAESGFEFIGGGGWRTPAKEGKKSLFDVFEENNVKVVFGPDSAACIGNAERVVMVNHWGTDPSNMGYSIDSIPGTLTLPFLTNQCLDHLKRVSPDAFFMMVEGGNIDHALHSNDGGTAVKEILNFNNALDIAYQFYKEHPDETLIVVTADHDTGGMTIGNPTLSYNARLQFIDSQKISKLEFQNMLTRSAQKGEKCTWDEMKEILMEKFGFWRGVPVTEKQEEALKKEFNDMIAQRNLADQKTLYATFNGFVAKVFKVFNDAAGIGFVTSSHTGNPVPVFAVGVGADSFKNLNNNIEIPQKIMELVESK